MSTKAYNTYESIFDDVSDGDVAAQLTIADALYDIADAIHALGTNRAGGLGGMGAIELLAKEVKQIALNG